MKYDSLNKELIAEFSAKEKNIHDETFKVDGFSLMKLRDILFGLGKIYSEDIENNKYIAYIYGGFFKKNRATAIFKLVDDEILVAIYAKEGLFNQHTCEGVINEFRKRIEKYLK